LLTDRDKLGIEEDASDPATIQATKKQRHYRDDDATEVSHC
jgi:hypothetical protein